MTTPLRCDKCGVLAPRAIGAIKAQLEQHVADVWRIRCPACVKVFGHLTLIVKEGPGGGVQDLILRLADVFSLPLDPLVTSLEYSRTAFERKEAEARELERQAREATEVARAKAEAERREAEERQQKAAALARSFELFCEELMDLVPVPLEHQPRKQWYINARALFELKV